MRLTSDFIVKTVPSTTIIQQGTYDKDILFSIDSRTIGSNEFFVALPGNRVDGHDFIEEVLKRGAAGVVIAHDKKNIVSKISSSTLKGKWIIAVPDTRTFLIALASAWRTLYTGHVVSITGSVGKTSTKQLTSAILQRHNVAHTVSQGNHNTLLGVALTLLRIRPDDSAVIVEMGINKRTEMAKLAELARPTTAVITAIGHSHMEGLGSLVDIATEKRDIFKFFKEDSIGIVNGDIALLSNVAYAHPVIKFGSKTTNQIQARKIMISSDHTTFILKLYGEKHRVKLPTNHRGAVFNALAAAAVAYLLKVPSSVIVEAIQTPLFVAGRFETRPLKAGSGVVINDCYNASPESMKAALVAFQHVSTQGQKIAVLGDMLELGVNSPFWHRQLGRLLRKAPTVRHVVLVGSMVEWTKKTLPLGVKVEHVATWQEAVAYLKPMLSQEIAVLVKGSQGMKLVNLVNEIART